MPDDGSRIAITRQNMVAHQVARRGVKDRRVLEAMARVPREVFVSEGYEEFAYEDSPLPIAENQTISQPFMVAAMAEAAAIKSSDKVLEVGAGSGYAAAVLAELAAKVVTIERHKSLASGARARLAALDYRNVDVHVGDGTLGWPDEAPFDAILVAAGAPRIPEQLKRQLAIGGRLIIPVGEGREQSLRRIVRTGEDTFEDIRLGAVRFVPLVGAEGWAAEPAAGSFAARIRDAAEPLPDLDDPRFGEFIDRFADGARVVMLGEASHGTSEFYRARAAITWRLVTRHGFRILAVEADWPDAAAVDRYIRARPPRAEARPFQRFPTWMWRNVEMQDLVAWLHDHNQTLAPDDRCGFYGLDLYNMSGSISAVLHYLDAEDPAAAATARQRYGCLTPWQADPSAYGRAVLSKGYSNCEAAVVQQCRELLARQLGDADGDDLLDAAQNARLIASAEQYYRVMYYGGRESWNLRDTHMFETLRHLLDARGPTSRAVVWAHNSHIGDARATEMGAVRGEVNLGQLARETFGDSARLIGFGTHQGTVAAASDWDGDMEVKAIRPSHADSYERLSHDAGEPRFLLDLREGVHDPLRDELASPRLERYIGVIYRPDTELASHYAQSSLSRQFDAWVWFDTTRAVTPLGPQHARPGAPDTWPFGV